jgi:hypothetical protein
VESATFALSFNVRDGLTLPIPVPIYLAQRVVAPVLHLLRGEMEDVLVQHGGFQHRAKLFDVDLEGRSRRQGE